MCQIKLQCIQNLSTYIYQTKYEGSHYFFEKKNDKKGEAAGVGKKIKLGVESVNTVLPNIWSDWLCKFVFDSLLTITVSLETPLFD